MLTPHSAENFSKEIFDMMVLLDVKSNVEFILHDDIQEVIYYPDKIVLKTPILSHTDEMIELVAKIKLAEFDPLLCTLFFQYDLTDIEVKQCSIFAQYIMPLIRAWSYRLILEKSEEIYMTETSEMFSILSPLIHDNTIMIEDDHLYFTMLEFYMILSVSNRYDVHFKHTGITDPEEKDRCKLYQNLLLQYSKYRPDATLLVKIFNSLNIGFNVDIETDDKDFRHFTIKQSGYSEKYMMTG